MYVHNDAVGLQFCVNEISYSRDSVVFTLEGFNSKKSVAFALQKKKVNFFYIYSTGTKK